MDDQCIGLYTPYFTPEPRYVDSSAVVRSTAAGNHRNVRGHAVLGHLGAFNPLLHSSADAPAVPACSDQYKPVRHLVQSSQQTTRVPLLSCLTLTKEEPLAR